MPLRAQSLYGYFFLSAPDELLMWMPSETSSCITTNNYKNYDNEYIEPFVDYILL